MNKQARADEVVDRFRVSTNQDAAFDNLAARRLGVSTSDLHCLNIIQRAGGLPAGRLAAEAGLTTGAVTGVINRLERAGYARRSADARDRRRVLLSVTTEFLELAGEVWGPVKRDWDHLLTQDFTSAQLDVVIEFLRGTNELGARHIARLAPAGGGSPALESNAHV